MTKPKNPKTPIRDDGNIKPRSKFGPIPLSHFENDMRFNPNTNTSPGSLVDRIGKRVEADKAKKK